MFDNVFLRAMGFALLLALGGFSQSASAAFELLCVGEGNDEGQNWDAGCDWSEIDAAIGPGRYISNADLEDSRLGRANLPANDDPFIQVNSPSSGGSSFTITLAGEAQVIVEKFSTFYSVYVSTPYAMPAGEYTLQRATIAEIELGTGLDDFDGLGAGRCSRSPGNCSAGTSHVTAYVPIPAAAWLFGSALIGLIAVARRRVAVA